MIENQRIGKEDVSPRGPARVLIVDDEESIRRLVSKWTDVSGYEVKAASSAEAALLIMGAWTADVARVQSRLRRFASLWPVSVGGLTCHDRILQWPVPRGVLARPLVRVARRRAAKDRRVSVGLQ